MFKVLVIDDDADLRLSVATALSEGNYFVEQARDGEEGVNRIKAGDFDLVLLDVNMPRLGGIEALKEVKRYDPSIIVIMLTAFSNVRDAIESTREGAYNYLEKPVKAENLVYMVDKALKAHHLVKNLYLSAPVFKLPNGSDFIGQSSEMKRIFSVIDKLTRVDTAVLIRGESGTGKELVAKALHFNGPRKDNRFVTINCSAIPETLIESEFFGHEKGAFTGADSRKIGKFQYADGGTLFLDEIGDISLGMQVKLLRALQEKKFMPVGSNREIEVNVRILAATNRPLEEMIKRSEFREDLFYRLNVLPVRLPPLRERRNDIDALVKHFIEKFNHVYAKKIKGIADDVGELIKYHSWPGNIRELENVIEHAFVIESGEIISISSLPESLTLCGGPTIPGLTTGISNSDEVADDMIEPGGRAGQNRGYRTEGTIALSEQPQAQSQNRLDFQASKEEFERHFLIHALKIYRGRINQTALHANIPKKTLLRKLQKYGITAKDYFK